MPESKDVYSHNSLINHNWWQWLKPLWPNNITCTFECIPPHPNECQIRTANHSPQPFGHSLTLCSHCVRCSSSSRLGTILVQPGLGHGTLTNLAIIDITDNFMKSLSSSKHGIPEYDGMITTIPQSRFWSDFPETHSQNLICYHWLSMPGNSKILHCGILFDMP